MQHQSEESVFNMALAYLQRIDKLLYKCQESALGHNIDSWRDNLMAVYRELSVKLKANEKEEIFGKLSDNIDIRKVCDLNIESSEVNFITINKLANNPTLKIKHKSIIFYLLNELDIKIRGKLQERGMLLPSKEDARFAVLKR